MPVPLVNRQRARLLVLIFVLLSSIYLISYSARIESGDTHRFFNAVSSLANHSDFYLDLSASQFPPQDFTSNPSLPLQTAGVEPLQVFLAVPLYVLARIVPGIGMVQTVYLFNIFVSAVAGCFVFLYALALGYDVCLLLDGIQAVNRHSDDGRKAIDEMIRLGAVPVRLENLPA